MNSETMYRAIWSRTHTSIIISAALFFAPHFFIPQSERYVIPPTRNAKAVEVICEGPNILTVKDTA